MACSHNRAKFSLLNRHRVRHPIPCAVRGCGDLNYTTNIFRGPYVGRQTDVRQKHRLMPLPYLNAYHGILWNRLCTFYTILLTNIQTNKRRWNHNLLGGVNKDSYIYIYVFWHMLLNLLSVAITFCERDLLALHYRHFDWRFSAPSVCGLNTRRFVYIGRLVIGKFFRCWCLCVYTRLFSRLLHVCNKNFNAPLVQRYSAVFSRTVLCLLQ